MNVEKTNVMVFRTGGIKKRTDQSKNRGSEGEYLGALLKNNSDVVHVGGT